jgi:DNA-binding transcriptional regulator YbjK
VTSVPTAVRPPKRAEQRAERRGAILAATVRILGSRGLGAVTHRAVAREADVPLAATTYYFSSKDEMITEALGLLAEEEITQLQERAAQLGHGLGSPTQAATALIGVLLPDEASARAQLAKFEVYLEAARRPALRETAAHWQDAFIGLAEAVLRAAGAAEPAKRAPLLVTAIDGVLMYELSRGTAHGGSERLRGRVQGIFELIVGDPRK